MSSRTLSQLGLGLLGVWALVEALVLFPQLAPLMGLLRETRGSNAFVFGIVIPLILLFAFSYVLVFHNNAVARRLFPVLDTSSEDQAPPPAIVAVGLLGILIVVGATPQLARSVAGLVSGDPYLESATLREVVGTGIQTALGVFLVFRPARILGIWQSSGGGSGTPG